MYINTYLCVSIFFLCKNTDPEVSFSLIPILKSKVCSVKYFAVAIFNFSIC